MADILEMYPGMDVAVMGRGRAFEDKLDVDTTVTDAFLGDLDGGLDDKTLQSTVAQASPPETHKVDLTAPEAGLSRLLARWRAAMHTRVGRAAAIGVLIAPAPVLVACGGGEPVATGAQPGASADAAPGQGGGVAVERSFNGDPTCFVKFEQASADLQEQCRIKFADLDNDKITRLTPLDQDRWAGYYAYEKLGANTVLNPFNSLFEHQLEDSERTFLQGSADQLFNGYQQGVFSLAYWLQKDSSLGQDPRTIRSLIGVTLTKDSQAFKDAQKITGDHPLNGADMQSYVNSLTTRVSLYKDQHAENVQRTKKADGSITVSFRAERSDSGETQIFTYTLRPYLSLLTDTSGKQREVAYDPTDPLAAGLGQSMLGGLDSIKSSAA